MTRIYRNIMSIILFFLIFSLSFAQNPIANPGFENWTDTAPDEWYTYDVVGLFDAVTPSEIAHTGSYAAKGTVVDYMNEEVPPYLASGIGYFSVSENFTRLTGYYQFVNNGQDALWVFATLVDDQEYYVAGGVGEFGPTAGGYTQFAVNLDYSLGSGQPAAKAIIWFAIENASDAQVDTLTLGSYFLLDDVAFDNVNSIAVDESGGSPRTYRLVQNYPNPFNPSTTINFIIPQSGKVSLSVFNSIGQTVETLIDKEMAAGDYKITFNAENLPSGIYFYKLEAGNFVDVKKMMLLR